MRFSPLLGSLVSPTSLAFNQVDAGISAPFIPPGGFSVSGWGFASGAEWPLCVTPVMTMNNGLPCGAAGRALGGRRGSCGREGEAIRSGNGTNRVDLQEN